MNIKSKKGGSLFSGMNLKRKKKKKDKKPQLDKPEHQEIEKDLHSQDQKVEPKQSTKDDIQGKKL